MEYKEVFIFVAGMTPQIITETLYALHHKKPPVHPDEIHILTTTIGKKKIEKGLISEGRLESFYKEFEISNVAPEILVVRNVKGTPLTDIKTAGDNEDVGDFIVNFIKEKVADEGTRLHCSIAGGRKTMSFYLGSALSLFGRPWDRLYHVLLTPEFESHPDFYWKPVKERRLETGDGRELNTKDCNIFLAELPFVRLKERFSLNGKGFKELVAEGQREIDTASIQLPLTLNLSERTIQVGSTTIEMVPMQLIIYSAFLREKLNHCRYPEKPYCLDCTDCFPFLVDLSNRRVLEEMSEDYKKAYDNNLGKVEELFRQWPEGMDIETLRQHRSKINRTIKEHLKDETLSSFYTIAAVGKHGSKKHGVKVEKGKIAIQS